MKKEKVKPDFKTHLTSETQIETEESIDKTPVDVLSVEVLALQTSDEQRITFAISVAFFDTPIVDELITSSWARDPINESVIAEGSMNYDPSDYAKMCLFADEPLVVTIMPATICSKTEGTSEATIESRVSINSASSCNVDILPLFLGTEEMSIKIRMQPVAVTSVLNAISWDNLPLLTMKLSVDRDPLNDDHHNFLANANYFRFTLIGCYNLSTTLSTLNNFTAASKTTMLNEMNSTVVKFYDGYKSPKGFSATAFFPHWESVRFHGNVNAQYCEKFNCNHEDIQNDAQIDLKKYFNRSSTCNIVWASFHRTLIFEETEQWLLEFVRRYSWPFELCVSDNNTDYSLMASLDLFKLLYPGENTVRLAVPLQWFDETLMREKCNCDKLLEFTEQEPSTTSNIPKSIKGISESVSKTDYVYLTTTGNNETAAFVVVEVALRYPMKKPLITPHISTQEIKRMLKQMETQQSHRECTGRGQLTREWINTIKMAANALRRIAYYGTTDFCTFDRQFSSTRTRVEMVTSFSEEAAIYVNNNFVPRDFLESKDTFKELILMSHACLVREATDSLLLTEDLKKLDPVVRAARHARHFQDVYHASELYFQCVSRKPRDANLWRELATCLQDLDQEWADVCLDKSVLLNPRHPLTLLSKGCMIFQKDADAAEPFFLGLLYFHPFWLTGMMSAKAYFMQRENFQMADAIGQFIKQTRRQGYTTPVKIVRAWEHELDDWWDGTPLLPGMSLYYDAADLMLRLRGIKESIAVLAEVCLAQALHKYGESAAYYHLLALCCRLNGDVATALCHIHDGIVKYGEISYLRTLEAECYSMQKNHSASIISLEKANTNFGSYSILLGILNNRSERCRSLLAELLPRQPSAYAWMAFAEDWVLVAREEGKKPSTIGEARAIAYAVACATEALKIDKQASNAWALLARFVTTTARRVYCKKMAAACGQSWMRQRAGSSTPSPPRPSLCRQVGKAMRECKCSSICTHSIL